MVEAWAHVTVISAALSHQNHINYFRAFFLDEQRTRIESGSLLLSPFANLWPRLAAGWAVPSCSFWHPSGAVGEVLRRLTTRQRPHSLCFPKAAGREFSFFLSLNRYLETFRHYAFHFL